MLLAEIKAQFSSITGMPATKQFALLATGLTELPTRMTKAAWLSVLDAIQPHYRIAEVKQALSQVEAVGELERRIEELEAQNQELTEQVSKTQATPVVNEHEDICWFIKDESLLYAVVGWLFESIDWITIKGYYKDLSKKFHPDLNADKQQATLIMQVVNNVYEQTKDTESNGYYQQQPEPQPEPSHYEQELSKDFSDYDYF